MTGPRTLQNLLARIMSTPNAGPISPPPAPGANPFNLRIREGRENFEDHSKITASIAISLSENAPSDAADVVLNVEPYMVMDDDMKKDSSGIIALESAHVGGVKAKARGNNVIDVAVVKNKMADVKIESARFARDQYAGLDVEIHLKDGWDNGTGSDSGS